MPLIFKAGALIFWQYSAQIPPQALNIWFGLFVITFVIRLGLYFWYQRTKSQLNLQQLHFALYYIASACVGILWGVLASVMMPQVLLYQFIIIVMVIAIASSAMLSMQPSYLVSATYAILSLVPMIIWALVQAAEKESIYTALAPGATILLLVLLVIGRRGHLNYLDNLKTRLQNVELLENLTQAKNHLEVINKSLVESENHFRLAFDNAFIGIALVSLQGRWLKVNQAMCELLGCSAD